MRKKYIFLLLLAMLLSSGLFVFTACNLFGGDNAGKVKLSEENVYQIDRITGASKEYTGQEITLDYTNFRFVKKDGKLQGWDQFDYTYENNVNAGKALITITAKEDNDYFYGSLTLEFAITRSVITVNNFQEMKDAVNSKNYRTVEANSKIVIPEGETIHADSETWLEFYGSGTIHENHGTIISDYTLDISNTQFVSSGQIITNGRFLISSATIYNSGDISLNNGIENKGKIYTNSIISGVALGEKCVLRQRLSTLNTTLSATEVEFEVGKECEPTVTVTGNNVYPQVTYENNDHVCKEGEYAYAVVKVTDETNTKYFGEVRLPFVVKKGKAKFKNYAELVSLQETGNFYEYTCYVDSTLTSGNLFNMKGNFTLNEDEILNASIYLEGDYTFTNNGNVTSGNYLTIENGATFENNGTCSVAVENHGSTTNNGEIKGTVENYNYFVNNKSISGPYIKNLSKENTAVKLINNSAGSINATTSVEISSGTEVENNGLISAKKATISGNLLNKNTFLVGDVVTISGSINNNSGASLRFNGKTSTDNATINNNGTIHINSDFSVKSNSSLENSNGEIINNGHMWVKTTPSNIYGQGDITVRTPLSQSTIVLSNDEFNYTPNTAQHPASFTVNGETLPSGSYSLGYKYEGENYGVEATQVIRAGTINFYITITDDFCKYESQAVKTYRINKVDKVVTTISDFKTAIKDSSYSSVKLGRNLTLTSEHETVYGCVIDTNGYILKINGNKLTCQGDLIVKEVQNPGTDQLDTCAIQILGDSGELAVYSKLEIESDAKVYISTTSVKISIVGELQNNGAIYAYEGGLANLGLSSGSGNVYLRKALLPSDIQVSFANNETVYNGSEQKPTVTVFNASSQIVDPSCYTVDYGTSDAINAGEVEFNVVINSLLDENYTGQATVTYTIKRATKDIYSSDSINFDERNYWKYTLKQDYTLSNSIEIPNDVIFDIGPYTFDPNGKIISVNKTAEIWVTAGTYSRLAEYLYIADKITLSSDITPSSGKLEINFDGQDHNNRYAWEHTNNLTLDLNGKTINGYISFSITRSKDVNFNIISSASAKGKIVPSSNTQYAVIQKSNDYEFSATFNINFENVEIKGVYFEGAQYYQINLSATNCNFLAAETEIYMYAVRLDDSYSCNVISHFSNCDFTAYTCVALNGGQHIFENCYFSATGDDLNQFLNNDRGCAIYAYGKYYDNHSSSLTVSNCSAYTKIGHGIVILNKAYIDYEVTSFTYNATDRSTSQAVYEKN